MWIDWSDVLLRLFSLFFGKDDWAKPTCDGVLTLVVRFAVDRGANFVETAKPPTRLFST